MTDSMNDAQDLEVMEPRLWKRNGWTAKVVKNSDDDGWAVEMTRAGDSEPALVGPWTMGRDKKNPKPLDQTAFMTLVKTANEVLSRHEQAARARLHKSLSFIDETGVFSETDRRIRADLDIARDEDDPHAILALFDERTGEALRSGRVSPAFKLSSASVKRWITTGE